MVAQAFDPRAQEAKAGRSINSRPSWSTQGDIASNTKRQGNRDQILESRQAGSDYPAVRSHRSYLTSLMPLPGLYNGVSNGMYFIVLRL